MNAHINLPTAYPNFIDEDYKTDIKLMSDKNYDNMDELFLLDSTTENYTLSSLDIDQNLPTDNKINNSTKTMDREPDNIKDSSSSEWEFVDNWDI